MEAYQFFFGVSSAQVGSMERASCFLQLPLKQNCPFGSLTSLTAFGCRRQEMFRRSYEARLVTGAPAPSQLPLLGQCKPTPCEAFGLAPNSWNFFIGVAVHVVLCKFS